MTAKDTNADLAVQLETLAKELRELDARNLELEQLAAQRGVKLSCANIALSRAKIAFEQAANRREEMVQDVAHDLRTPLTSIKGATQNLLDDMAGPLSDSAREYVEIDQLAKRVVRGAGLGGHPRGDDARLHSLDGLQRAFQQEAVAAGVASPRAEPSPTRTAIRPQRVAVRA